MGSLLVSRGVGRPRLEVTLRELILRMARENPGLGCARISGELLKVGHSSRRRRFGICFAKKESGQRHGDRD